MPKNAKHFKLASPMRKFTFQIIQYSSSPRLGSRGTTEQFKPYPCVNSQFLKGTLHSRDNNPYIKELGSMITINMVNICFEPSFRFKSASEAKFLLLCIPKVPMFPDWKTRKMSIVSRLEQHKNHKESLKVFGVFRRLFLRKK